jgi:hypothetical protein
MRARVPVLAILAVLVAAPGCGSSKPGYCSDRAQLEQSVKELANVGLGSGSLSAAKAQLTQVERDAKALVSSAKSDFPSQTRAIDSSISALTSAVAALPASPTAAQIASLVPAAQAVVSAVGNFADATSSSCD